MTKKFYYGGQAVIEGVMMRGQKAVVTTVRCPDGSLATKIQPLPAIYTGWMMQTPLLRGIIVLIEALVLGIKSLLYSANISLGEEKEEVRGGLVWAIVIVALVVAVALFFIAPLLLTKLLNIDSPLLFNLVDGFIRVAIFLAYLKVMTVVPDIRRVFAYHGAEHQVVNAYEAGIPLEVESVSGCSTAHVRCGTSFLFSMLIIAMVVFVLVGQHSPWLMVLSRIVLIPIIAALSYEVIYFGARHINYSFVRMMLAPGLWLQALTTREPDDSQREVALAALKKVMEVDQLEVAAQTPS